MGLTARTETSCRFYRVSTECCAHSAHSAPRLGLSIPNSPSANPVDTPPLQPVTAPTARQMPPALRLATPLGSSQGVSTPPQPARTGRPQLSLAPLRIGSSSSEASEHSRNGSFGDQGGVPISAASSISTLGFVRDPPSAVGSASSGAGGSPGAGHMERENSLTMDELAQHLEDMRLSLGRDPDVADLDDEGWRAVSKEGKVIELGSLGEGAGGAVTRCVLKGGKMVFALKVSPLTLTLLARTPIR
jgi:mitogen-activated protein kinase kinase